MSAKQWFAVRTLVANSTNQPWGPTDLGAGEVDYEERVTLWRADSPDAAIALAENESQSYAMELGGESLGLSQCFALADAPGHGVEVFSLIRRSDVAPDAYVDRHFDTGTEHQGRTS